MLLAHLFVQFEAHVKIPDLPSRVRISIFLAQVAPLVAGDDQTQPIRLPGSSSSPSEQTTLRQEVYPGMTLGGRYLIEKELGRGGIAIVYLIMAVVVPEQPQVTQ